MQRTVSPIFKVVLLINIYTRRVPAYRASTMVVYALLICFASSPSASLPLPAYPEYISFWNYFNLIWVIQICRCIQPFSHLSSLKSNAWSSEITSPEVLKNTRLVPWPCMLYPATILSSSPSSTSCDRRQRSKILFWNYFNLISAKKAPSRKYVQILADPFFGLIKAFHMGGSTLRKLSHPSESSTTFNSSTTFDYFT